VNDEEWEPPGETTKPNPWTYRDPTRIPPRQWLLGNVLMRGYTTLLGASGGTGKTALAIAMAMAVITGRRDICGLHSFAQGRVWFITLEDDRLELERRIAAAILAHNLDADTLDGNLFVNGGPLKLAVYGNGRHPTPIYGPDAETVTDYIRDHQIVLTVIDPLVKAHALNGNANEDMDFFMTVTNEIARVTNSALLLPTHFRKGPVEENGDGKENIRGASSLIDGARLAYTLLTMTPKEADDAGIDPDERGQYARLVNAKANMVPAAKATEWFELRGIPLGNTELDPAYPNGDDVQATVPWNKPDALNGLDHAALKAIFDALDREISPGLWHSPNRQSKQWGGHVIIKETGKTAGQASAIMRAWEKNAVYTMESYLNPSRNQVYRIILNRTKADAILASQGMRQTDGHDS